MQAHRSLSFLKLYWFYPLFSSTIFILLYFEPNLRWFLKTTIDFSANSYPLCCLAFLLSHYIVQFSRCRVSAKDRKKYSNYQVLPPLLRSGGDKRNRTVDPLLAKQVLYQLSYTPILSKRWWAQVGSNHRPYDYQSYALAS